MMDLINVLGISAFLPSTFDVMALLALVVAGLIVASGRLRSVLTTLILVPPALLMWVFGAIAFVLWRPAVYAARRLFGRLSKRVTAWLESARAQDQDPLPRGDRYEAARRMWREDRFPFLYKDVPTDILRPLYEDGKLVGGVDIVWLADKHMTRAALTSSILAGFAAGLILLATLMVKLFELLSRALQLVGFDLSIPTPILEQWPGQPAILAPSAWWWDTAGSHMNWVLGVAATLVAANTAAWCLFAVGGAILTTLAALRLWQWEKSAPYTLATKDADVRWGYRMETRELSSAIYNRQIALSEGYLAETPLFRLGAATGTLRLRGDIGAPTPRQPLCLDRDSLFQHLLVLGGTGEGKTTAILKPLMRQLMADRTYGFYICDAKAVLWADARKVAEECGRAEDVIVIGTGEGQFGVNPLAGLTPTQIAATLRSVLRQVSGNAHDNFWPEMAANVIRHMLTLALSYRWTKEGQEEMAEGLDPYSLWWAYQTVLSDTKLAQVVAGIRDHSNELDARFEALLKATTCEEEIEREAKQRAEQMPPETHASLLYVEGTWATMAPETKSGIIASVTQLLDGFAGARELRERFACGRSDENTVSVAQALEGRIVLNALTTIEDGMPARLVLVLLKTALYREARKREALFKAMDPPLDPQKHPCIVMIDEVQEIATSDPASGLSDTTFWNVARSTGVAGIFATQTLAALTQALGDAGCANFIQQARSKVFFRSEDERTIEYACWCAGAYERNRVFEDEQRESIDHRVALDQWDPFAPVDETETVKAGAPLFWSAARALLSPGRGRLGFAQRRRAYEADLRFAGRASKEARVQMEQSAVWRAEELERAYRTEGNMVTPALTAADLINMGRWHAFAHIQRAGAARQDIISVEHDYA